MDYLVYIDYLKCSLTQIKTDLWTIFKRNRPFEYIEKVLDLWVQLMKNGGKNKSVAFIILFSVYDNFHFWVNWSLVYRMQSCINKINNLHTNALWWFRAPSIWFTYNISFSFHCIAIFTFVFYKVTQLVGGWSSTDSFYIRNYRRWTPIWGGKKITKKLCKRTVLIIK